MLHLLLASQLIALSSATASNHNHLLEHESYYTELRGTQFTKSFHIFFYNHDWIPLSPMHDIPLRVGKGMYNMVVEIPRWTNAKMECNLKEMLNPIKQDTRNGKVRYVANVFPYTGYLWNYGFLPQTWEDPDNTDPRTGFKGDGDPIDVCEIGSKIHPMGTVLQVKVLGIVALIDSGETDWKVLTIDVHDPLAKKIHDLHDIEEHMPGLLEATVYWFRNYKIPNGSPPNTFGFDGAPQGKELAFEVIEDVHSLWRGLMERPKSDISRKTTILQSNFKISEEEAYEIIDKTPPEGKPGQIPHEANIWHYLPTSESHWKHKTLVT